MLLDKLSRYASGGAVPMHMPGHKRRGDVLDGRLPWALDITEIDAFDDLHNMSGVLGDTARAAAALYGSATAFPLVGGSTCGILAAISACTRRGEEILLARNCHKSVYHAAEILGLRTAYLYPRVDESTGIAGEITPEQVAAALAERSDCRLVVLTSPTYEGVVSDVTGIARAAHERGVPILVDAAHGAHFGFSPAFPETPVKCGADLVVMSLHKTLPALTQCALLHVAGGLVDAARVARQLAVFETSSPSYVLLSSIDYCVRLLAERGAALFSGYEEKLAGFYGRAGALTRLRVLDGAGLYGFDRGKLVVDVSGASMTGPGLMRALRREHGIELEMAAAGYAVAMTSVCDRGAHLMAFAEGLLDLDRRAGAGARPGKSPPFLRPRQVMTISRALEAEGVFCPVAAAAGRVSAEYVWRYPPGIPLLAPGETVPDDLPALLREDHAAGITARSTYGRLPDQIRVLEG